MRLWPPRSAFLVHLFATFAAFVCLIAAPARAADGPLAGQTIKFYIGAAPGGPVEVYARLIADHMSKSLGANIVIEVRPGANGVVAANIVQDQPADGRTVWVATQSMIEINPFVYSDLRWTVERPEDLAFVRAVFGALLPSDPDFGLEEIVGLLAERPDLAALTAPAAAPEPAVEAEERADSIAA